MNGQSPGANERVYLSGPMAGRESLNRALFESTADRLQGMFPGWEIVIPHAIPPFEHEGECGASYVRTHGASHGAACYLKGDLIYMLRECSVIVMLPGWTLSVGARTEFDVARLTGLRLYEVDGGAPENLWLREIDPLPRRIGHPR
jgi:hypothetical protein